MPPPRPEPLATSVGDESAHPHSSSGYRRSLLNSHAEGAGLEAEAPPPAQVTWEWLILRPGEYVRVRCEWLKFPRDTDSHSTCDNSRPRSDRFYSWCGVELRKNAGWLQLSLNLATDQARGANQSKPVFATRAPRLPSFRAWGGLAGGCHRGSIITHSILLLPDCLWRVL